MGLMGSSSQDAVTQYNGINSNEAILGTTIPVVFGQNRVPWKLLWYGDFKSAQASSGGGSGLSKAGSQYVYTAAVLGAVCHGAVTQLLSVWDGQGRYVVDNTSEAFLVPTGGGTYTVYNSSVFVGDVGVYTVTDYAVDTNDYGGTPTTLTGIWNLPFTPQQSGTPLSSLTYTSNGNGTYTFSPADAGMTVQITYNFYRYNLISEELAVVPPSSPYSVVVQKGAQWTNDAGVQYYPSGVAMLVVGSSPLKGQYSCSGGVYYFNPADAGQGITINYNWKDSNVDNSAPSTLNLTLLDGSQSQPVWSYLTSSYPAQALGYTQIACVASSSLYLGSSPILPSLNFEILALAPFGAGIPDACPSDCIQGVLSDPGFGVGFNPEYIDASLQGVVRDYWVANGYFISPKLDTQSTAESTIGDWCEAGQVYNYWSEGLLKFTPLGDSTAIGNGAIYVPPTQPIVSLDDDDYIVDKGKDPVKVDRSPWQNAWNRVQIGWAPRTNDYNTDIMYAEDEASINQYGLQLEDSKTWGFICNDTSAQWVANLRCQRSVYVRSKFSFTLKSNYAYLEPGDIVEINDTILGLKNAPVRILKTVDDPKKGISIEAENFPYSISTAALYSKQGQFPSWVLDLSHQDPGDTNAIVFEAPDRLAAYNGNEVHCMLSGGSSWGGCGVYASFNGSDYNYYDTVTTPAKMGVLGSSLPIGPDPDTTNTLLVNMQGEEELASLTQADADNYISLCGIISASVLTAGTTPGTSASNAGNDTNLGAPQLPDIPCSTIVASGGNDYQKTYTFVVIGYYPDGTHTGASLPSTVYGSKIFLAWTDVPGVSYYKVWCTYASGTEMASYGMLKSQDTHGSDAAGVSQWTTCPDGDGNGGASGGIGIYMESGNQGSGSDNWYGYAGDGTAAPSNNTVTYPAWNNPGNAGSPTVFADCPLSVYHSQSQWLECTGFDFTGLPQTVSGIQVSFNAYSSTGVAAAWQLQLLVNGVPTGNINTVSPVSMGTSGGTATTVTYGGANEMWGINSGDINDTTFGVAIQLTEWSPEDTFINNVAIQVFGSNPTATGSPTLELISYENAALVGTDSYNLTYLRRGAYNTPIMAHSKGDLFFRADDASYVYQYDPSLYGQTIYLKFPAFNLMGNQMQSLDNCTVHSYQLQGIGAGAVSQSGGYLLGGTGSVPNTWSDANLVTTATTSITFDYTILTYTAQVPTPSLPNSVITNEYTGTITATGLTAGTTYRFYPYLTPAGVVQFVNSTQASGAVGTSSLGTAIAFTSSSNATATAIQARNDNTPLSSAPVVAATTTSGTGTATWTGVTGRVSQ